MYTVDETAESGIPCGDIRQSCHHFGMDFLHASFICDLLVSLFKDSSANYGVLIVVDGAQSLPHFCIKIPH